VENAENIKNELDVITKNREKPESINASSKTSVAPP
jgi:hypothetical protein